MKFYVANASVIGPSHITDNLPNQDHLSMRGRNGGWIAAVSDGLGSHIHSDIGSRFACKAIQSYWRDSPIKTTEAYEHHEAIHQNWLSYIHPYSVTKTGATALYASISKSGWVHTGQLGDGLIIYRQNGQLNILTPSRQGFGNQTESLGHSFNRNNWVYNNFQLKQAGDGIILMTDGISDDLVIASLPDFFELLYQESLKSSRRRMKRWLEKELTDWATPLHGDDKTLAAIFWGTK